VREALHAAAALHNPSPFQLVVADRRKCPGGGELHRRQSGDKYFGVTGADFSQSRYASDATAAEAICKAAAATVVMAPATSRWRGFYRRRAAARRTRGHALTGVAVADGKIFVSRWYIGSAWKSSTRTQRPWFIGMIPAARRRATAARARNSENGAVNLTDASKRTTSGWHSRAEG